MELAGKKVLVTGAGGFIGSHLVEALLKRGCQVRAMLHYDSRPHRGNLEYLAGDQLDRLEVISGDVCDPFFVDHAVEGRDAVFHLAALIGIPYSYVAPMSYVQVNVGGTTNVLHAARRHKTARVVHTSTSETYGTAQYTPIDEKHPLVGQSPYSASKIGADMMADSFFRSFDLPVATLRPFNTYGPRQSARAVIPTIVSQLVHGAKALRLGSLAPRRDLTFVADTAEAFIRMAECDAAIGQVVSVGTGQAVTIGELAHTILRLMGRDTPIKEEASRVRPDKSEVMELICDRSLAGELLGWRPTHNLEQGLEKVIGFVKAHPQAYKPEVYAI